MAIEYKITKHAVAFPAKMLASTGGAHVYNLLADKDTDNGMIVAKDAWQEMEVYSVKDSTATTGVVLGESPNGTWYVEITEPGDGIMVRSVPMIAENFTHKFGAESNFYNVKGDIMKGLELSKGDIVEISTEGFDKAPTATKTLTVENRKWKVGD